MRALSAFSLAFCLTLGCDHGSSPTAPSGDVSFSTVSAAKVTGSAGPQIRAVVRSEAAWSQVWSDLWGDLEPARPPVDFSRDMVVVVTASGTCFGGVEVERILATGGGLRVLYGDAAPSSCLCVVSELVYHAVRAPQLDGDAVFEARQTPVLCPTAT